MNIRRVCEHTFVEEFLEKHPLILDCGANKGEFSRYMSEKYEANIYGFEPDPRLFSTLPILPNVQFFPLAVTGANRQFKLRLGESYCSSEYFCEKPDQSTITVNSTILEHFCQKNEINKIALIKLDIEGSEIEVLLNASDEFLNKVGQITVEFHDFLLKDQSHFIQKVVKKLREAGFIYVKVSQFDHSDSLFINAKLNRLNLFEKSYILLYKYVSGGKRMIKRQLPRWK